MKQSTIVIMAAVTGMFVFLGSWNAIQYGRINLLQEQVNKIPTTTLTLTEYYKEPTYTVKTTARIEDTDCWTYCKGMLVNEAKDCRDFCKDQRLLMEELPLSDVVKLLLDYQNLRYSPPVKNTVEIPARFVK